MKVIHVGFSHVLQDGEDIDSIFEKNHYGSWNTPIAREISKRNENYEVEVWRPYDSDFFGNRGISVLNKWNLNFRTFPTKFFFKTEPYISISLIRELRRLITSGEEILVHVQSLERTMSYMIAKQCKNIPLVAQQRGGNFPPLWKYRFTRKKRYLLMNLFRKLVINNYDYFFSSSVGGTMYLTRQFGADRVMQIKGGGFDFDRYVPGPKIELKKELNLDLNVNYLLFVGRFNEAHATDLLIEVYKELKKTRNIEMICIGGNENQPMYNEAIKSGAIIKGYIPRDEVIKYMNATDIHLFPSIGYWAPFGDLPTALLESLSMNQPVISAGLINFLGPKSEIKKLGFIANSRKEIIDAVEYILANPEKYKNTREIVSQYYNWERIVSENVKVYGKLFKKYYS